ncbi:MAG: GGDEF domain-containing protein [Acidimicrobiales bacterium]|nr:GGDEF domain-containing protein [Acidimicrobiales bacterium]MCB9395228.1 GGDEF domain-containing protein [Acidimicrobiaceae bacterium]
MGALDQLSKMQADAIEQLRAGDHNDFLVGFLTTAVKLELSNLVAADLDLATYAQAVVDVLTQHAPIEGCLVGIVPDGLPAVGAASGLDPELAFKQEALTELPDTAAFEVPQVATGALHAEDVPAALRDAGFVDAAAQQIAAGLGRVVESEQLRRRAAAARALRVVAGLDERWGVEQLDEIAAAFAALPGAASASITATAPRFAGTIAGEHGRAAPHHLERRFVVDDHLEVVVDVGFVEHPAADQVGRLDEIVEALSAGLERIEVNLRLAIEADTDQLTGVGNRRRASKALAQARQMAESSGRPMSVLLCDLDHFKQVNDQLGHQVGDEVLAAFAGLLKQSVRAHDTVIRWGGEEFLVICPSCDAAGAASLATRLLEGCPDACAPALPEGRRQTTSIGVAEFPIHAPTPEALVGAADDALYRAKREGRNQFRTAG